jgi:hypothetical protein
MHRLIARLLLISLLSGVLSPAALAFSPDPPHACCLRKHHGQDGSASETRFQARTSDREHDCCRALGISHGAKPSPKISHAVDFQEAAFARSASFAISAGVGGSPAVRGPPPGRFPIA